MLIDELYNSNVQLVSGLTLHILLADPQFLVLTCSVHKRAAGDLRRHNTAAGIPFVLIALEMRMLHTLTPYSDCACTSEYWK